LGSDYEHKDRIQIAAMRPQACREKVLRAVGTI